MANHSNMMNSDTISAYDLVNFSDILADIMRKVSSLEELEGWFNSQKYVESVKVTDYLVKTEPPQKELLVTFKMDDGSTVTRVIDIILYPDQTLALSGIHET